MKKNIERNNITVLVLRLAYVIRIVTNNIVVGV